MKALHHRVHGNARVKIMSAAQRVFWLISAVVVGYLVRSTRQLNIGMIVGPEVDLKPLTKIVDHVLNAWTSKQEPSLNITWVVLNSAGPRHTFRTAYGMVNNGIQGLVTGLRCSQSRTVSTVTERFRVPHLSVDLYPCPPVISEKFTLHLSTPYKTLARVLGDVTKASGWRHAGLAFNHKLDYTIKQEVLVQLSLAGIQSVLLNNWRPSNMTEPSTNTKIFFMMQNVDKRDKTDKIILPTARVVVQDIQHSSNNNQQTGNSVTDIVIIKPRPVCLCLMAGLTCTEIRRHLTFTEFRFAQAAMMFNTVSDDIATDESRADSLMAICSAKEMQPFIQDGKTLMELKKSCGYGKSGYCENLNLSIDFDLYVIPAGSGGRVISIGEWTEGRGLTIYKTAPNVTNRLFTNKLYDFGGVTLRIGVHGESAPFSNRVYPGSKTFYGMTIDMLEDIASKLNFRYTIEEPADNLYGARLDNGSWSGVIGMLQRGEIDIGVGIFTVTTERTEVLDFTTGFIYDGLGILTPKPVEAPDLFQIFKPFSLYIWLAILAAIVSSCAGFAYISSKCPTQDDDSKGEVLIERSAQENMFLVISSCFDQGPTFHPSSVSARCFLTFWFIFTVLTMTMYTAHLAAVLTVSSPVKPIDTLKDLAEQKDLQIHVREGASTWSFFVNSKKQLYRTIASRIVVKKNINKYISSVGEGGFSIIGDRGYLQHYVAKSCGKSRLGSEEFQRFPLAFIIAKGSPYKNALDNIIQKMVESGVIDSLSQKWIRAPARCPPTNSSGGVERLGLNALGGIFIVYGAVTSVAACVLLVELICKYRCTGNGAH